MLQAVEWSMSEVGIESRRSVPGCYLVSSVEFYSRNTTTILTFIIAHRQLPETNTNERQTNKLHGRLGAIADTGPLCFANALLQTSPSIANGTHANTTEPNVWELYRDFLSPSQYLACFIAGGTSSSLSLLGSLLIAKLVIQRNDQSIPDRLMLGLSLSDIITRLANLCQPFVIPTYTKFPYAIGNNFICQFSGFWLLFSVTSAIYSAGLAVYFYCFVLIDRHREWPRQVEPYIHGIGWTMGLLVASASVKWIRPSFGVGACLVTCASMDENVDCIDAPQDRRIVLVIFNAYVAITFIAALVGIGFTIALCRGVKRQQEQNSKYYSTSDAQRPREVAMQAVFYLLAYINSLLAVSFDEIVHAVYAGQSVQFFQDPPTIAFVSMFVLYLLYPLQGFLNCLVYIRPRLLQWKKMYPTTSWSWCFCQTLHGKTLPLRQILELQSLPSGVDHDLMARTNQTTSCVRSASTQSTLETPIEGEGAVYFGS